MAKSYTLSTVTVTKKDTKPENCEQIAHQKQEFQDGTTTRWLHPAIRKRNRWFRGHPWSRPRKIQAAHSQGVRNTEQRGLVVRTKWNYRNWIKEMYVFFYFNYKDYYNVSVQKLSKEDGVSLILFHYKARTRNDLIYTGINVQMVKTFLAHKK
jgi:hypothetical protein